MAEKKKKKPTPKPKPKTKKAPKGSAKRAVQDIRSMKAKRKAILDSI